MLITASRDMDDPGENLYIKKEDEEIDSLPLPTLMCECRSSRDLERKVGLELDYVCMHSHAWHSNSRVFLWKFFWRCSISRE
jgi:hypothetical protein